MPAYRKDENAVARNLRYHRKLKGLTQEQLSESSGVAVRTIQRIENAKAAPHAQTLALLARSLGLEVHELSDMAFAENANEAAVSKWLLLLHLSPVIGFIIPFANLVVPLILWAYKKSDHSVYNEHGKAVVNFHITVTLAFMVGVALLLILFPVGLLLILLTSAYALASTLWNAMRVLKNERYKYPFSIRFI